MSCRCKLYNAFVSKYDAPAFIRDHAYMAISAYRALLYVASKRYTPEQHDCQCTWDDIKMITKELVPHTNIIGIDTLFQMVNLLLTLYDTTRMSRRQRWAFYTTHFSYIVKQPGYAFKHWTMLKDIWTNSAYYIERNYRVAVILACPDITHAIEYANGYKDRDECWYCQIVTEWLKGGYYIRLDTHAVVTLFDKCITTPVDFEALLRTICAAKTQDRKRIALLREVLIQRPNCLTDYFGPATAGITRTLLEHLISGCHTWTGETIIFLFRAGEPFPRTETLTKLGMSCLPTIEYLYVKAHNIDGIYAEVKRVLLPVFQKSCTSHIINTYLYGKKDFDDLKRRYVVKVSRGNNKRLRILSRTRDTSKRLRKSQNI